MNDLDKLPNEVTDNIRFIPVETYMEALNILKGELNGRRK